MEICFFALSENPRRTVLVNIIQFLGENSKTKEKASVRSAWVLETRSR